LGPITVTLDEKNPPQGAAVNIPNDHCEIYLVVKVLVLISLSSYSSINGNLHFCRTQANNVNIFDSLFFMFWLQDLIDVKNELTKLETKLKELELHINELTKKMNLPDYEKTPEKIKEQNTQKLEKLKAEITLTKNSIEAFNKLKS
jgi:valyl-tRNA synthetase